MRSIAVIGGGSAGWIAAAILARALMGSGVAITLVESAEIGIIGVGEATIPPFVDLLGFLGIPLDDLIRHTSATIKLGIRFDGWNGSGSSYWHPFGAFGAEIAHRPFHHALLRARADGGAHAMEDFSLCASLAAAGHVFAPDRPMPAGARFALHLDAVLLARYLRQYGESLGVRRIEATVVGATRDARGLIGAVTLGDGRSVEADLWIDASGFNGVLIDRELHEPYCDWSAQLPCDRALAAPTARDDTLPPYTLAAAMDAGWRWRIPLQHRCGNGYVYASAFASDDDAARALTQATGAEPPLRHLRFVPGRRARAWVGNCVAVGLASGFLEPLESTSIHLAAAGVLALLDHFPGRDCDPALAASYNAEVAAELEHIRDFLILHYCLSARRDTPFWRAIAAAPLPDSLAARIALYRDAGTVRAGARDLFTVPSWFYVCHGMGCVPRRADPLLASLTPQRLATIMAEIARDTRGRMAGAVPHAALFAHPSTKAPEPA